MFSPLRAATGVEMVDGSFEESDFEHVAGQYQVMWDRIPAESNVTHAIVMRPKVYGVYNMSFARITYVANSEGKRVVSHFMLYSCKSVCVVQL